MDVLYLFRVLLKRKWIIIGAAFIAIAVAYFLTSKQPKFYRSTAQISTGFAVTEEIKVNNENFSMFDADTKFNNAIVTWYSPTVLSLISYNLILHDLNNASPFRVLNAEKRKSQLFREINITDAQKVYQQKLESMSVLTSFNPEQKKLLEYLGLYGYDYKNIGKTLQINRMPNTDYIQIDCITENPELSAFIVNTAFQQFLRYYKNVRSNRSQESIDTLQSLLEKKKQELDAKNSLLRQNGSVDISQENSSTLDLIMSLETTLTDTKSKLTSQQFALQRVNQKLAALTGGRKGGATGTPSTKNDELVILRRAVGDAYTAYVNGGSSDPALLKKYNQLNAEYQAKVNEVQAAAPEITEATPETSRSSLLDQKADLELNIQASNSNISAIQEKINSLKATLTKDAGKSTVLEGLLKDAELANKEYQAAKQKFNDAMDINTSSVNNFRQVLMAQPAIEPEPSKRILMVGMAGASAMIFTILIIVVLATLDSSIKTPIIFSKMVDLKLISMVNLMNLKNKTLREITTILETTPDALNNKRHNIFREALRKLRHEVESSGKKIFLFASTKKGEGKTTLIEALSYSMSLSKKKILIIDTNFCNPDLTTRLHADPILEKIHPDKTSSRALIDQIKDAAKDIGVGYVSVIGSEGGDYTPSEILPRENILHHLQTLTTEFDFIFLEGPPLNDFSDARELVQYVDGVIAVFSATHIIKQVDKDSIDFFKGLNGKFCGAVLNMVDPENVNVT